MANKLRIALDHKKIAEFCRRWKVVELAVFGSVLHDGFRPDSDVDVLLTFSPEAARCVFDLMRMKRELSQMLGRSVDLVDRRAIEQSDNYIRRRHILESAEVVYGS